LTTPPAVRASAFWKNPQNSGSVLRRNPSNTLTRSFPARCKGRSHDPSKTLLLAALLALGTNVSLARVKLVALPERARVVVSLDNPDKTLVEEERSIPLQKGVNQVDFSWSGVNIDTASIQIRMLDHPAEVLALNTSYPPNENALIWSVASPEPREERVRISYLLDGLTREIFYQATTEPDETALTLRSYLRLGYGTEFKKSTAHEEVLELLSEKTPGLPVKKLLTWDSAQLPWDPEYQKNTIGLPLSYVIKNDKDSKLGVHTLAPGKARIFLKTKDQPQEPGQPVTEGVAFIGEDWVTLTPVDREARLSIGQGRDVKVTQRQLKNDRTNLRRNNSNQVVLWDTEETYKIEVENFKKTAANLVVVEHFPGYWKVIESSREYQKKNAFTLEYPLVLPPETTSDKKTVITLRLNHLNVQGNEPSSF
jgi:hypothetical protein